VAGTSPAMTAVAVPPLRSIELFAGAGGLAMGVARAGFQPAQVIEWNRWCCDTLRENRARGLAAIAHWPDPTEGDVRGVDFRAHEGRVDLVTGGPPCQPFSLGGRHRAHLDARDMWPQAVRALREAKPRAFIFENVKGLTRESFASYLSYIVLQLSHPERVGRANEHWAAHLGRLERHHLGEKRREFGYRVVYRVLNAADYGVPQRRQRVVFVGFRNDLDVDWSFPEPTHSAGALAREQARGTYWDRHGVPRWTRAAPSCEESQLAPWRTVRDALGDLPDPELEPERALGFFDHGFQPGARAYPGHTGSPLDEPAKTLKAGVHGVPGGENMLRRIDGSARYFTVRESARLQTFPDDYRLRGAWSEAMRQLGNAVPVRLAEVVARHVARAL
jgi:DNA (cytosine-5)-methyltransferase 1